MKSHLSLILFISMFLIGGCQKELEQITVIENNPWRLPHTSLFGVKSNPREVRELIYDNEQLAQGTSYSYDENGNLIYYNPWYAVDGFEKNRPSYSFDWGTNADRYSEYKYEYDSDNRIKTVTKINFGEITDRFEFAYGKHKKYAPMPLPLGNYSFYLLEGLSRVVSENEGEIFVCDGNNAVFKHRSFLAARTVTFTFNDRFPIVATDVSERNGQELSRVETEYEYNDAGYLLKTIQIDKTEQTLYTTTHYSPVYLLNLLSVTVSNEVSKASLRYTYNEFGWPIKIMQDSDDTAMCEEFIYTETDSHKNWIRRMRSGISYSDPTLPEGTLEYVRQINY